MSQKSGASIGSDEVEPIATYLASLASGATSSGDNSSETENSLAQNLSLFGTVSPLWRGGDTNIQNSGFFPDVWTGINWQSAGPVSARATACVTCHVETRQTDRLALVDAAVRLDLKALFGICTREVNAAVEAGRFIVPFGAFASQSNPANYRTVSKPLIYNMGQRVFSSDLGDSVLPMPYSDEGANFNFAFPVYDTWTATVDTYIVNGLQGGASGIDYYASRDYVDNNTRPAVGGRVTVGNQAFRMGSSLMSGQFGPTGGGPPLFESLNYKVYGWDATYRCDDAFRIQLEYARRDNDRIDFTDPVNISRVHEGISGYVLESEWLFWQARRVSALVRLDQQNHLSELSPPGSMVSAGPFAVRRITYGFNWTLPGGSLLMVNHEHWILPRGLARATVDVLGARWVMTF